MIDSYGMRVVVRAQVEERLAFYDKGTAPTKNIVAMQAAMEAAGLAGGKKKKKKSLGGGGEEAEAGAASAKKKARAARGRHKRVSRVCGAERSAFCVWRRVRAEGGG